MEDNSNTYGTTNHFEFQSGHTGDLQKPNIQEYTNRPLVTDNCLFRTNLNRNIQSGEPARLGKEPLPMPYWTGWFLLFSPDRINKRVDEKNQNERDSD